MNITLDACIQITSNCPQFDHLYNDVDQEIMCIVEEAFVHWDDQALSRTFERESWPQSLSKKQTSCLRIRTASKDARKVIHEARLLDESGSSSEEETEDSPGAPSAASDGDDEAEAR